MRYTLHDAALHGTLQLAFLLVFSKTTSNVQWEIFVNFDNKRLKLLLERSRIQTTLPEEGVENAVIKYIWAFICQ